MLLSAMLLAAAVQGGSPPIPPPDLTALRARIASGQVTDHRSKEDAIAAYRARQACQVSGLEYADQPAGPPAAKRLDALPPANHTLTVLRSVDGCPVSSTIRFNVDRPARR